MFGTGRNAELVLDLGTATICVQLVQGGDSYAEPAVIAFARTPKGQQVVATGEKAKSMLGRTPRGTEVVAPIAEGRVQDFNAAEALVAGTVRQVAGRSLRRPRVLIPMPMGLSGAEERALKDVVRAAGARDVASIPSVLCTAYGCGLDISRPEAHLVVDVGAGRTQVALMSMGSIIAARHLPLGGDAMDEALKEWLHAQCGLAIGARTAEQLKLRIGAAHPSVVPRQTTVRGRDLRTGVPRELALQTGHSVEAVRPVVGAIRDIVLEVLAEAPPELAADLLDKGVILVGGGARISGLDDLLREATGLPVICPADPQVITVRGAAKLAAEPERVEELQ